MNSSKVDAILSRIARIEPTIRAGRDNAEINSKLDKSVYDAMKKEGLFSLPLPHALGGEELHPVDLLKIWETVARIDSAAGWNLAQASAGIGFSGRLGPDGMNQIYNGGAHPVFAGAGNPPLVGVQADNGYIVSGQVPFVTGVHHADWLFFVMLPMKDGTPVINPETDMPDAQFVFLPGSQVCVLDNWDVLGMRATGSADVQLDNVFVPDTMIISTTPPETSHPAFTGPLFAMHPWPVIHGEAVVSIAIAASAIELFRQLVSAKVPAMSQTPLGEREWVQLGIGRAQALVGAARALLYHSSSEAFTQAEKGPLPQDHRVALQLAACHAAESCAKAVDLVHECAGSSAIRNNVALQRHFRDIHVCTQHATKSTARYVSAGRVILGLEADIPMLAR